MRIIQSIASTRRDHGGTSRSVPAVCDALVDCGVDNHLLTAVPFDKSIACNFPRQLDRVHLAFESAYVRQMGVTAQFRRNLRVLSAKQPRTIVHDHAVWLPTNHAVARFCRQYKVLRVVSPRGMLGDWAMAHGRFKKCVAWAVYQHRDLRSANAFHATSEQEAEEIRSLGFTQPIAVIPNGICLPTIRQRRASERPTALFLSRVHAKKGLINLVHAWAAANGDGAWRLKIAGPSEAEYQRVVEHEVAVLGLDTVQFLGPITDKDKWQHYADADLFVLPSFNENYGIAIAEAMAAGLPVITTTGTPWSVLGEQGMGWWVAPTVESLTGAMSEALSSTPDQLKMMGSRGAEFIRKQHTWAAVAQQLRDFYDWLFDGGDPPDTVRNS